ncbi:hypothetical protein MHLP_01345 [Candidatus Mycoplasma haematolamae str. Purdue]|uniref:Uncharacterized protein n=1 Tax=Mycoplasma haematolamae (strain Purdue) TaxID=1212765 RepID=I7CJ00_MYCHA|nr:hypothetical protein [Candidatus Mycoplasma haematolamae]AFO51849.1 hypothetical protein MHLP_01345 [Candidatus Mycoplasma haematolamae str. Purdue]
MILGSIAKGIFGLGALGGIGTAGVMWGPEVFEKLSNYISIFKESDKGEAVKYTVKISQDKSEILDCDKKDNEYTILKLEKDNGSSQGSPKAKLVCGHQSTKPTLAESWVKSSKETDIKSLTCVREKSTGKEQTYWCAIKDKELKLGKDPAEKPTSITISWTS